MFLLLEGRSTGILAAAVCLWQRAHDAVCGGAGEDLDSVLDLVAIYYREDGYPFNRDAAGCAAGMLLADAALGALWIAEENGEVVGYLAVTLGFSFEYRGRDACIDELFIADGHRARGLGKQALALAESHRLAQRVKALHLGVESHRCSALSLYEQHGFELHQRRLMTKVLAGRPSGGSAPPR